MKAEAPQDGPRFRPVDVIDPDDVALFRTQFFDPGRPVVLRNFLTSWPALGRWSPASFAHRFATAEVEAMTDLRKNSVADDAPYRRCARMTMHQLVDAFGRDDGAGDVYLVAQNQLLRRPAFHALWEDISLDPAWFDEADKHTHVSLWMGPRGSVTPLHYDLQNALLAQAFGTKSVILAAPEEAQNLYPGDRGYARVDPEHADLAAFPSFRMAKLQVATIGPGDALFLPYGWWHHVRALTDSISLTLACFAWRGEAPSSPG